MLRVDESRYRESDGGRRREDRENGGKRVHLNLLPLFERAVHVPSDEGSRFGINPATRKDIASQQGRDAHIVVLMF